MQLVRTENDKIVAGVAAGLGRAAGIDPTIVRVAFAASVLLGGTGIWLYLVLWVVLPRDDGSSLAKEGLQSAKGLYDQKRTTTHTDPGASSSGRPDDYSV